MGTYTRWDNLTGVAEILQNESPLHRRLQNEKKRSGVTYTEK